MFVFFVTLCVNERIRPQSSFRNCAFDFQPTGVSVLLGHNEDGASDMKRSTEVTANVPSGSVPGLHPKLFTWIGINTSSYIQIKKHYEKVSVTKCLQRETSERTTIWVCTRNFLD